MLLGEHRHRVGADFVRHVAVRRDAIGANDDEIDLSTLHHGARHVVGDDRCVDAVARQLPRGQPGALHERACLVGHHDHFLARFNGSANDAERRAVARRRQRARVAMRQHPRRIGHHRGAKDAHGATARQIFVVNVARIGLHQTLDLIDRLPRGCGCGKHSLQTVNRPEQIHGRRPRRGHQLAQLVKLSGQLLGARRLTRSDTEREPHRRGHAYRRRAANDHRPDGFGYFLRGLARYVYFSAWQLALIDHDDTGVVPLYCRKHEE